MTLGKNEAVIKTFAMDSIASMVGYLNKRAETDQFKIEKITVSFDKRRVTSYGGIDSKHRVIVNLGLRPALHLLTHPGSTRRHHEYEWIADDPDIGAVKCTSWRTFVACHASHEVAHCFTDWSTENSSAVPGMVRGFQSLHDDEHGTYWQSVYRILRVRFVNMRYQESPR